MILEVVVKSMQANLLHYLTGPEVDASIERAVKAAVTPEVVEYHLAEAISQEIKSFTREVAQRTVRNDPDFIAHLERSAARAVADEMRWWKPTGEE